MASESELANLTSFLLYSIPTQWWACLLKDDRVMQGVKQLDKMSESDLVYAYRVLKRVAGIQFKTLLQRAEKLQVSYKSSEAQVWTAFAPGTWAHS
jgi:hypothetical protein